ncbi:basic amino acid ABC transporter substrate-binding protein [Paenibacillus sp. N3.4]|nr:basic amino acid ABC transporter substrate-binding protein [Paenibacillus sp. N3.4]
MVLAFALVLIIALTGCGAKESAGTKYKFATDAAYAPMEYMDKDKLTGFDIDFLGEVMKEAGLPFEVAHTGWETMLTSVKQGSEYKGGIASISITDERKQSYDFSMPYFESVNMILVKEGSTIKNATDLKDKKVAVQISTTADILMSKIMGADNKSLKRLDNNTLAFMELDNNGVDAVVADIAIIREYVKNNPKKKIVAIADPQNFESEYYGILLPKGSELKTKLDASIKKVIENGTYSNVYKKWFGQEPDTKKLLEQK